jgi:ketosteroid isomerase-like protein
MIPPAPRPAQGKAADAAAEVRQRLEAWAAAVGAHDLPGVVAHHHRDIVLFDVPPPVVRGIDGYRKAWPPFFRYIGTAGQFALDDLTIVAGDDVAFAHAILVVRGDAETQPGRVRLTVGLRKVGGQWMVLHEHHSAPYEGASSNQG